VKYIEQEVTITVPLGLATRIEECLYAEVINTYVMITRGFRPKRVSFTELQDALDIVQDTLLDYETNLIVGDSLTNERIKREFPLKRTRKNKGKS
jgi:hypothetical protein